MTDLTRATVTASFSVGAGTYAEGFLAVTGLTPDGIAELVETDLHQGISLCHQCASEISDPEVEELIGFSVNGVYYEKVGHEWVAQS